MLTRSFVPLARALRKKRRERSCLTVALALAAAMVSAAALLDGPAAAWVMEHVAATGAEIRREPW